MYANPEMLKAYIAARKPVKGTGLRGPYVGQEPPGMTPELFAPGFVNIAAAGLIEGMDEVHDLRLRVGALPRYPSNRLKYNLTWSTAGLINEYIQPCDALVDGSGSVRLVSCDVIPGGRLGNLQTEPELDAEAAVARLEAILNRGSLAAETSPVFLLK